MGKEGQMKSQLLAASQLLKTSKVDQVQLISDNTVKTANFKERTKKRSDEALAVGEAIKILSSSKADKSFNTVNVTTAPKAKKKTKLLQESEELAQSEADPSEPSSSEDDSDSAPLSFVEARSRVHRHLSMSEESADADPFKKVKTMLRGMLRKLNSQQAQDTKKAAWCDDETAKSTKEQALRKTDVQKLKDRVTEMNARLVELDDDINTTTKDLSAMRKATNKAAVLRKQEAAKAASSLVQYKDAQKILKSAMVALKKFYDKEDGKSGFKQNGMGSGVIGILEVAYSDYSELEQELTLNEKVSVKDFNDFMQQNTVRMAVFNKDLEYNNRAKIKIQGDKMRTQSDLKSYQKELDAITAYLTQLKASCTIKGDTYTVRQAKRKKLLESLMSAMNFLNGKGMA